MYANKFLNFVSIYLAVMIDQSTCDEFTDYLFAGSDKVTVLSNYPATASHETNQFESKKLGLLTKIKDVISGWISSKIEEAIAPELVLTEGTYSCVGGTCTRLPGDQAVDYRQIKEESARTTLPGENDLTRDARGEVHFIDPPEILKNIDPTDMVNTLETAYQEKRNRRPQK